MVSLPQMQGMVGHELNSFNIFTRAIENMVKCKKRLYRKLHLKLYYTLI